MASDRKIKCPFCTYRETKDKVIDHIDHKHEDMIPENYSAARVLFDHIHHKNHGTCVVCKRKTEWDENIQKYKRLCGRSECRDKLRSMYKHNMMKVYGKTTILDDPEHQKKMLANRGISGIYRFDNGKIKEYTGSYEKKFLEFLDKVLHMDPDDIMMPGPTLEYEYKGQKHFWILDFLLLPFNLVGDIKDGGNNPNKTRMPEYRAKQVAKEKMITNMGEYNYIRLTNNQFDQLLEFMYEYKMQLLDDSDDNRKAIIKINESTDIQHESIRNILGADKVVSGFIPNLKANIDDDQWYDYNQVDEVYFIYPYHNGVFDIPMRKIEQIECFDDKKKALYYALYLCTHGATPLYVKDTLHIDPDWWNEYKSEQFYFLKSKRFIIKDGKYMINVKDKFSYSAIITNLNKIVHEKCKLKKNEIKFDEWVK